MTRDKCKIMLPVINAYAEGLNLQYLDYKGVWTTPSEEVGIGFGANVEDYRVLNSDNSFTYFKKVK